MITDNLILWEDISREMKAPITVNAINATLVN
jgi:hypothetical protein